MKWTNRNRDFILIIIVSLIVLIRLGLIAYFNHPIDNYDVLLIGLFPMIAVANIFKIGGKQFAEMRFVSLFLLVVYGVLLLVGKHVL